MLLLLSEVTGEARPYGKETVDLRQGRTKGGDPMHFHTVNVAQPVRFSSKLQTCPKAMPIPRLLANLCLQPHSTLALFQATAEGIGLLKQPWKMLERHE